MQRPAIRSTTHDPILSYSSGWSTHYYNCHCLNQNIVCSTPLLAPRIGLYTASLVSLKEALIGWSASDYDAPIQLWRIQINTGYTLPSPTWRASPTWRKHKTFPLPGTAAMWVFKKNQGIPWICRGRRQSYARRHGMCNSLTKTWLCGVISELTQAGAPLHSHCRHREKFWPFTGPRMDSGLILLISNMIIHRSFTGPTHLLSPNVRGPGLLHAVWQGATWDASIENVWDLGTPSF